MPAMRAAVKLTFKLTMVVATIAGHAPAALGFSASGHRVVGAIADSYLCPEARAYIAPLLNGASLASAGVWADTIREDAVWAHTKPWHYINVGDHEPMEKAAGGSLNVLSAIAQSEKELADVSLSLERRAEALRFYVHFVADVHQPLHVGRAEDHGGNDISVRWRGGASSLHELWDAHALLALDGLDERDEATAIGALAVGQEAHWQEGGPMNWAEESRALRLVVYDLPDGRGRLRLSDRYVTAARNVVRLRLAQAAVRLAGRLNRLACRNAPDPGKRVNR